MRMLSPATGIALAGLLAACGSAFAQTVIPPNPNITIDYVEPRDPARLDFDPNDPKLTAADKETLAKMLARYEALKGARDRLQKSRLLERYALFLSPLRLPTTLRLVAKQCDQENAYYSPEDTSLNFCYEYLLAFEASAPKETTREGITREEAIIGSIISTMLHETGHALFSIYRVPILGREEDAADQIAGFTMLQFGTDVAKITIKGAAWKWYSRDWQDPAYHDVHSTPQQRFYNYLCMGYGGNPDAFRQFIDLGWLPKLRAPNCTREYQQAQLAFEKTIYPHLDPELAKKVLQLTWIQAGEIASNNARSSQGRRDQ